MTYQPPPSEPGATPPPPPGPQYGQQPDPQFGQQPGSQFGPPPGGQWGPPPGGAPGKAGFDPKTINPLDWGIMGAGLLAFIFSLFDYYTVTASGGGFSASASFSAWHGFFGWFGALVALAAAAAVAVTLFAPQIKTPAPARLIGLGGFAVATLCVILALFVIPDGGAGDFPGIDEGHGFGYWASLIVIIAGLAMSLMRFQQTGGQLPGNLNSKVPNVGGYGPQGGIGGSPGGQYGNSAPPQPGYGSTPPPPPPGYGSTPPPPPPGYGPPSGQ